MPEPMPVRIPLENVNDETVKLVAWLVEEGAEVHEGEGLAEVETSKATFELTAPVSGRVWRKVSAGEDVAVGSVVCCVGADAGGAAAEAAVAPPAPAGGVEAEPAAGPQTAPAALPPGTRFSKPALDMLRRHVHPLTWSHGDLDMAGTFRRTSAELEAEIREHFESFIASTNRYLRNRDRLDQARKAQYK